MFVCLECSHKSYSRQSLSDPITNQVNQYITVGIAIAVIYYWGFQMKALIQSNKS